MRSTSNVEFVTTVTILVTVTQNRELTTLNAHTIFPTHIRTYHMPFLDMLHHSPPFQARCPQRVHFHIPSVPSLRSSSFLRPPMCCRNLGTLSTLQDIQCVA